MAGTHDYRFLNGDDGESVASNNSQRLELETGIPPATPANEKLAKYHSSKEAEVGHFSGFVTWCFAVNVIMGSGFLGIPWAFQRSGWLLGLLVSIIVAALANVTKNYVLEAMTYSEAVTRAGLREQVLKTGLLVQETPRLGYGSSALPPNSPNSAGPRTGYGSSRPVLQVSARKFEMVEMCAIFGGLGAKRAYSFLIVLYFYGCLWGFTGVFASALSSYVPLPFLNGGNTCAVYSGQPCHGLFKFYIALFALVVVPLSCLGLREQRSMQVVMSVFRVVMMLVMMATVAVAMSAPYASFLYDSGGGVLKPVQYPPATAPDSFKLSGLHNILPVAMYSQIFHPGIPVVAQPAADKTRLNVVFRWVLITTFSFYSTLGLLLSAYFGPAVTSSVNIMWAHYTAGYPLGSLPLWVKLISYLVVLFPALDIVSAFPVNAICLGNNLLSACTASADIAKVERNWRIRTLFRLAASLPPIFGAMLVNNLGQILDYVGLVGFVVCLIVPTLLVLKGSTAIQKLWPNTDAKSPYATAFSSRVCCWAIIAVAVVAIIFSLVNTIISSVTGTQ